MQRKPKKKLHLSQPALDNQMNRDGGDVTASVTF